jgi:Ca-activated chloride channel family protein
MAKRSQVGRVLVWALALVIGAGGTLMFGARAQQPPAQQPKGTQAKPSKKDEDEITLPQDDEVERVNTDLTTVLFTAVDKNKRFITTIRQEDIRILEDGVPQSIFTFQRETERPLSLAILIDTSASQERTLPDEKNAAREFVDAVVRPSKDEVAVVSFTGDSTLEQGMTGSLQRIRHAIDRVEFVPPSGYVGNGQVVTGPGGTPPISGTNQMLAGSTAIWDAIIATSDEIFEQTSDKTRRALILVTDGADTSSRWSRDQAIDAALKADAVIYSIGIGDAYLYGVEEATLRKISERTGGRAYFPKNEEDLRAAFAQIQQELRSQYLIAYSPTNKARDGQFRQVKIDITNPDLRKENLRLTYRQGYFAKGGDNSARPIAPTKTKRP